MQARAYGNDFFWPVAATGLWLLAAGIRAEDKDPQKLPPGPLPRVAIEPRAAKPVPGAEPPASDRRSNIRVDSTLVQINVTVTTPLGQVVTGMEKEHFRLFEDKVEQKLVSFTSEEAPLSVGLVFDISGSMGNKLPRSCRPPRNSSNPPTPGPSFSWFNSMSAPNWLPPWTHNPEEIINRLAFTQAKGRTALLDGLYLAMNEMKKAKKPHRKAILVLSDGGDNSSRYTESEIKNLVREADVQMYAMGIYESIGGRGRTPEEMSGPGMLSEPSQQTGGRHFPIDNISELPDVAAKILGCSNSAASI